MSLFFGESLSKVKNETIGTGANSDQKGLKIDTFKGWANKTIDSRQFNRVMG